MQFDIHTTKHPSGATIRVIENKPNDCDHMVILVPGFNQIGTTARKWALLTKTLDKHGLGFVRWDPVGCGLSDGDFADYTVADAATVLKNIVNQYKDRVTHISFVAHSLGACVLSQFFAHNDDFSANAVILLAPAFDQASLLRYWHVRMLAKQDDLGEDIVWENFAEFHQEDVFMQWIEHGVKKNKTHVFGQAYFEENVNKQYQLHNHHSIMHVHGEYDEDVPLASVEEKYTNQLLVPQADHQLEKPGTLTWLEPVTEFLLR